MERFEALWNDWHRHVLAYALRRTDPATAEEVVSETFVIAWRKLGDVPADAPLPWLLAVARRVLANVRRGERRRGALTERLATESVSVAEPPEDPALFDALARLSERDREVLLLHAWEGLDNTEAATVLGISASAYGVRLHRARGRLGRELDHTPVTT